MLEQFAIVRRIRRLLREEVDDKRGDLGTSTSRAGHPTHKQAAAEQAE